MLFGGSKCVYLLGRKPKSVSGAQILEPETGQGPFQAFYPLQDFNALTDLLPYHVSPQDAEGWLKAD